jgi:hypothetical protein
MFIYSTIIIIFFLQRVGLPPSLFPPTLHMAMLVVGGPKQGRFDAI